MVHMWGKKMNNSEKYWVCVDALHQFIVHAGSPDVVVGLSGGIDSSLVAVMCADAFGSKHVHGVLLPGPYSSTHSIDDAKQLADNINIDIQTVSINQPYDSFAKTLAPACGGKLGGLAAENVQARCRMVCLMALSNAHGWMVINTGNKSEAMMGYSTLYGDMVGAFAPIGGLYKTDVFALSYWRNRFAQEKGEVPPIPEHVLVKPPSAELAPNQEDEKSLGIEYETLDRLLIAHVEQGLDTDALKTAGFDAADVDRVLSVMRATAFKRALEPPAPCVEFYE